MQYQELLRSRFLQVNCFLWEPIPWNGSSEYFTTKIIFQKWPDLMSQWNKQSPIRISWGLWRSIVSTFTFWKLINCNKIEIIHVPKVEMKVVQHIGEAESPGVSLGQWERYGPLRSWVWIRFYCFIWREKNLEQVIGNAPDTFENNNFSVLMGSW